MSDDGALMMVAASTSETLVNFYRTTWRKIPEDSHLHTCHREILKSYLDLNMFLPLINLFQIVYFWVELFLLLFC
jgi:hypothetical protein